MGDIAVVGSIHARLRRRVREQGGRAILSKGGPGAFGIREELGGAGGESWDPGLYAGHVLRRDAVGAVAMVMII